MAEYTKPLPAISTLNQPYWDGLKQRQMVLPQCAGCGVVWYPPLRFVRPVGRLILAGSS